MNYKEAQVAIEESFGEVKIRFFENGQKYALRFDLDELEKLKADKGEVIKKFSLLEE